MDLRISAWLPVILLATTAGRAAAAPPSAATPAPATTTSQGTPPQKTTAQGTTTQGASAQSIDPKVIAALEKMGAFLRDQNTVALRMMTTTDEVLDNGQKIQLQADAEMRVRRPDRLRADVVTDRKSRQFVYDGKSFTINAPRERYYATVAAPPTLRELSDTISERYDIELPLADLFYWGTEKSGIRDIVSAIEVGESTIGGVLCDQYALRQADVDWQLWVQRGPQPLPRKMVITTTTVPSQPQHTMMMTWQLNPKLDDKLFVFVPARDALKIELREVGGAGVPRQGRTPPRPR